MAWYSTGTVAVTANSPTVTGTSTQFSSNARVGDAFRGPDGRWYEVTNVASSTVISIKPNYQGSTASGQAYAVAPILGYDKDLSDRFNQIAMDWGATIAGIKPWALSNTGTQAQADMGITAVGRGLLAASSQANALSYLGGVTPGQMGWAGNAITTANLDSLTVSGLYTHGVAVPSPVNNAQGYVLHMQHGNPDFAVQQWYQLNSATGQYMRIKTAGNWSRWVLQYSQFNLLGAVSQSSGVPTGAVIDRGSNANGEYVRFADGTQICTMSINVTDQAIDSAYGPLFQGARTWSFPVAFSGAPAVSVGLFRWGSAASWGSVATLPSTTSATLRGFDIASRPAGTSTAISATAIGRWF
ncbi:pyocin knob domain-containing protein [Pseudomonas aeruginosa]|uniref:Uncharacterized protein n=1 Tax=Pseudomonas aeruginosa TaxID=287 RepID=A0A643IZD8_PSEAI|nr:pyocin knob domain-containing protein [Pseudomonas aeruginosa]EKV4468415.1 hypothetical protein [Pseudomonas aeruginosa]ELQ7871953.1 hypothetical protein [Pseudomonas aeruginosa]EME9745548.1 hypothetical protein [Pseudomonas aeruginosa]KAB0764936.1 hypothetical protein F7O97_12110 [Pseudomonas aeruginosa]MBH8938900.1 hypothetical protein [Pseudomonas aeruginosa]